VLHLASAVGVGQSMYDIASYVQTNEVGTAILLEALAKRPVDRLVVASSMSIYGEGLCHDASMTLVFPGERTARQLRAGRWELEDADGEPLTPVPTSEAKQPSLSSVYALNKYAQERLCLMIGKAYGIPTAALRFFNVYGPRQALSNPYTGVAAIFASRFINGNRPLIFEDGAQLRDFVSVEDVVRANLLAMQVSQADGMALNIGSGEPISILEVAAELARAMDSEIAAELTQKYRAGDVRHCFADISAARKFLGYVPQVRFANGVKDLVQWLCLQRPQDRAAEAVAQLSQFGLTA